MAKASGIKMAVLALIVANIIWGAAAPIFKWSFATIHPFTLGFLRFLIPFVLLGLVLRKKLTFPIKDLPLILGTGLFAIVINIVFFFEGISKTLSINAPIITSSQPVFIILASIVFLREKPKKKLLLGNLLGLTGILLIVIQPILQVNKGSSILGNVFLIFSMLAATMGAILAKKALRKYDPFMLAFWSFGIATLVFFPFAINEALNFGFFHQLRFPGIMGVLFGAIFSSLIGYALYFWALKQITASEITIFSYIDPVAGVLIAIPLVHEYPNWLFMFGSVLIFLGIFIATGRIHYHPLHKLFK